MQLDDQIKVALLTSILPSDLQDNMFQWSDRKADFNELKDEVMSLAVIRASLAKLVPMDVDLVAAEDLEHGEDRSNHDEYSHEMDSMGDACLRCGDAGHYARECPTPNGKSKWKGKHSAWNGNFKRVGVVGDGQGVR